MTLLWSDQGKGFTSEFDFSMRWGVIVANVVEKLAPRPLVLIRIVESRADGPRGGFNDVLELRSIEVLKTTGLALQHIPAYDLRSLNPRFGNS